MKVYEFLYNSDTCESASHTMSIHRTPEGAVRAMEAHKIKIRKAHDALWEGDESEFSWDYDMWWGTRETELQD